jgi:hypothetical protein
MWVETVLCVVGSDNPQAQRGESVIVWKPCGMFGLHCGHVEFMCSLCSLMAPLLFHGVS